MSQNFDEPIDIHDSLHRYQEVLDFFRQLESEGELKDYCNGSNRGGRWIFQIYSLEFVDQLANEINQTIGTIQNSGPVLEVMSGDGRLSELLREQVNREIVTTDLKDARYNIAYPKWVHTYDAVEAVEKFNPSVVIICWEPYLSMSSLNLVNRGIPLIWIGNPKMCGHSDLFLEDHRRLHSQYALSRHDSFLKNEFKTDVYLFNC